MSLRIKWGKRFRISKKKSFRRIQKYCSPILILLQKKVRKQTQVNTWRWFRRRYCVLLSIHVGKSIFISSISGVVGACSSIHSSSSLLPECECFPVFDGELVTAGPRLFCRYCRWFLGRTTCTRTPRTTKLRGGRRRRRHLFSHLLLKRWRMCF